MATRTRRDRPPRSPRRGPSRSHPGSTRFGARTAWWWVAIGIIVVIVAVTASILLTTTRHDAAESSPSPGDGSTLAVDPVPATASVLHEHAKAVAVDAPGVSAYALADAHAAPRAIVVAPNGTMWMTLQSQGAVARIDGVSSRAIRLTEFKVPESGSNPFTPVIGPDRELWVTDYEVSTIDRVTGDGSIGFYPIPFGDGGPLGMAVDANGTFWITDAPRRAVMTMTTDGTFSALPPVSEESAPYRVATNELAAWVTDPGSDAVLRYPLDGSPPTSIPLPTPRANPYGIATAADSSVWITEQDANAVARIDAGGTVTEFPLPGRGRLPAGIAVAPDGSIWVTDSSRPDILHLASDGTVEQVVSAGAGALSLDGIAIDAEGIVWAVAVDGNQLIRVDPAGVAKP